MRRIIFILGFIIIIAGIGILLWLAFFKPTPSQPISPPQEGAILQEGFPVSPSGSSLSNTPQGESSPLSGLPSNPSLGQEQLNSSSSNFPSRVRTIFDGRAEAPTLTKSGGELIFWNSTDSRFWTVTPFGSRALFSPKEFVSISSALFSPEWTSVIVEFPDMSKVFFDFPSQTQATLPALWKDISFSPDGRSIVFKIDGKNPSSRFLAIASADGVNIEDITTLGEADENVFPIWSPQGEIITLYTEHQGLERQQLYFVGAHEEQYPTVALSGIKFKPLWSPKGSRLLFEIASSDSGFRPNLWVMDALPSVLGAHKSNLHIVTSVAKCAWTKDEDTVYCAVPRNLPEGSALLQGESDEPDDIWKINVQTGATTLIFSPEKPIGIKNLFVSFDEKYLFFRDSNKNLFVVEATPF